MRTLAFSLAFFILQLCGAGLAAAQELQLNGIGSFEQLRKEYYVGGLYLPSLTSDPMIIEAMDGPKRMELRITAERWSQRRFAQWCNQSVPINNGPAALGQHADDLLALTNAIKDDLVSGDILVVEQVGNQSTRVRLNDVTLLQTGNIGLFNLVLNTWIGAVPPSSGFKQGILQLPTDAAGTALLTRYEAIAPSSQRKNDVAKWTTDAPSTAAAPAPEEERNVVALPPPGGDTVVRAKPTDVAKSSPSREAVASQQAQPAVAAPEIKLDKPSLATAEPKAPAPVPAATPKPAPASKPPVEPKPAPAAAAAPVAAAAATAVDEEEDDEQEGLLMAYRSNVMKLTYLNTQYPKRALDLKQEGLVVVKLTLNRTGKIIDMTLLEEAKYGALNSAAERAIKRSAPYPPAPDSLKGDTIEMELPFNFKL